MIKGKVLLLFSLVFGGVIYGQTLIHGVVSDENGKPIDGADVFIDGSDYYYMTMGDGVYELEVEPGEYEVTYSVFGFEEKKETVTIAQGEKTELNVKLKTPSEDNVSLNLDEITVVAETGSESETATLNIQKKAVEVKEVIGARELSKKAISDAQGAVKQISGVTHSEGKGSVYIRGLGDRYLYTYMNGLPVPSNDIEKKNIDLNLFSTDIIQNVAVSKTFMPKFYGDYGAGAVDVISKEKSGKDYLNISVGSNVNTNAIGASDLRLVNSHKFFGFSDKGLSNRDKFISGGWMPKKAGMPIGMSLGVDLGQSFMVADRRLNVFASLNFGNGYGYRDNETISSYSIQKSRFFDDVIFSQYKSNLTGVLNLGYRFSSKNKLSLSTLFINDSKEEVYEMGRNGKGFIVDQQPSAGNEFVRDQRFKQNTIWVTQLLGENKLGENYKLDWGLSYNIINSDEPENTINELSFMGGNVVFPYNTNFQQTKIFQSIKDRDVNGRLNLNYALSETVSIDVGETARYKNRDFESEKWGVKASYVIGKIMNGIDDIEEVLNSDIGNNPDSYEIAGGRPDTYLGSLLVSGTYASINFNTDRLDLSVGARYEMNLMKVNWDINNYVSESGSVRKDKTKKEVSEILPVLNAKYEISDDVFIRLGASKTLSMPEFKEISPFEYIAADGELVKGNPDLQTPSIYNGDLKLEYFLSRGELVSITGFYKQINNPVNKVLTSSASGAMSFDNTGDLATIMGAEFEVKKDLFELGEGKVSLGGNYTYMHTNQDLKDTPNLTFDNKDEAELEGAAPHIANGSLSYEGEFGAHKMNLAAVYQYTSDKIYSIGTFALGNRIEKGYGRLDLVFKDEINKKFNISIAAKNLTNPEIERIQLGTADGDVVIRKFQRGMGISIGFGYKF